MAGIPFIRNLVIFQHQEKSEKSVAMATGTNNKIPLSDESMPHICENKLVKFRLDISSRSREI